MCDCVVSICICCFLFSSRRRHTRCSRDWSSDVCSSDLVRPEMLRWARERAKLTIPHLERPFPKIESWEKGEASPTLRQLEKLAKATHVPIGYLFLTEPPVERIPIPDFRTMGIARRSHPSPNLLEMIYICQQRQGWDRAFARK